MVKTYPNGLLQLNIVREGKKDYDEVSDIYGEFIDLGTTYLFDRLSVYSTLDQDIVLQIGDSEINIIADTVRALDRFDHNGMINWKYATVQPTAGTLQILSY